MSATFRLGFVRDGYGKSRQRNRDVFRRKRQQSKRARAEAFHDIDERIRDVIEECKEALDDSITAMLQASVYDDDDYGFDDDDRFIGHLVDSAYKRGYDAGYKEGYADARA